MSRFVPVFIVMLFAAMTAIAAPGGANAAGAGAQFSTISADQANNPLITHIGYDDDDYDDGDHYSRRDWDYGRRRHHGHGHDGYGGHSRCGHSGYTKKRVCSRTRGHCYKRRECITHYGKEYCRYTRRCEPGYSTCKWVTVRHHDRGCGCRHYDW